MRIKFIQWDELSASDASRVSVDNILTLYSIRFNWSFWAGSPFDSERIAPSIVWDTQYSGRRLVSPGDWIILNEDLSLFRDLDYLPLYEEK